MIKKLFSLMRQYEELISYLIVGGMTTAVSLALYYGSVFTFLNPKNGLQLQAANVLSWIGAVAFAYVANRIFVFKSKDRHIGREASKFIASRVSTLLLDMLLMFVLVTLLCGDDKIAKLVSQVAVTIANYVFSKKFVFSAKHCC